MSGRARRGRPLGQPRPEPARFAVSLTEHEMEAVMRALDPHHGRPLTATEQDHVVGAMTRISEVQQGIYSTRHPVPEEPWWVGRADRDQLTGAYNPESQVRDPLTDELHTRARRR